MKIAKHILHNRVSLKLLRRIIFTSLLPVVFFALLTLYQVNKQADDLNQTQLQNVSQAIDYTVQDKLTFLVNELNSIINAYQDEGLNGAKEYQQNNPTSNDWFMSLVMILPNGQYHTLLGSKDIQPLPLIVNDLSPAENPSFQRDKEGHLFLLSQRQIAGQTLTFIARIPLPFLSSSFNVLPVGTQACLLDNQVNPLVCSNDGLSQSFDATLHKGSYLRGDDVSSLTQRDQMVYFNHILTTLNADRHTNWSVILIQPKPWMISDFLFNFPLVILLSILITTLILIRIIRKLLTPLDALTQASDNIKINGNMDKPTLHSNDEFEGLNDTLYTLSQRLNKHMHALDIMTSIDKLASHTTRNKKIALESKAPFAIGNTLSIESIMKSLIFRLRNVVTCNNCSTIVNTRHNIHMATHYYSLSNDGVENLDSVKQESIKIPTTVLDMLYEVQLFAALPRESLINEYKMPLLNQYEYVVMVPIFSGKELTLIMLFYYDQKPQIIPEEYKQASDIGQRVATIYNNVASEDKLYHKAHYDALTGLPNRVLFNERLYQSLQRANRNDLLVALLFIDLDAFKELNDSMGHSAGDEFLIEVAHRLEHCTREVDTVARLGGDEFTVILPDLPADDAIYDNVAAVAEKILEAVSTPYMIADKPIRLTVSVGIAIYPRDCDNVADLLKHADSAMYQAKNNGKMNFVFYAGRNRTQSTGTHD